MKWNKKTVLIAEDDETNYLLLKEYLEPTGISISRARNGLELLKSLDISLPDLVLLDIKMPFMDGMEAIKLIRERQKKLPVIAQTAYVMSGDQERILHSGCTDYLSKPIKEETLIKVMEKYLS